MHLTFAWADNSGFMSLDHNFVSLDFQRFSRLITIILTSNNNQRCPGYPSMFLSFPISLPHSLFCFQLSILLASSLSFSFALPMLTPTLFPAPPFLLPECSTVLSHCFPLPTLFSQYTSPSLSLFLVNPDPQIDEIVASCEHYVDIRAVTLYKISTDNDVIVIHKLVTPSWFVASFLLHTHAHRRANLYIGSARK